MSSISLRRQHAPWPWWLTLLLIACFSGGAMLFCTSMLSASTVMLDTATEVCEGVDRPVDQVVLILIDALRPDFVLSSLRQFARFAGDCRHDEGAAGEEETYKGPTLRYMEEALRDGNDASHGFFLVADAPTTTAQRIKAIGTGTMPAFLEAGSNFNSEATPVDSLLRQLQGSAVLLGDDTWEKLFPGMWKRALPIPSFDVADFDTNDDAVLGQIFEVLTEETVEHAEKNQARLVIGHFLGIDHVGHRHNSDNRFMDRKIAQLNSMLYNVTRTLRQRATSMNTMLLVMGDHGMTNSGDHGGDSAQETDTFLFAQYFRGSLQFPPTHRHAPFLSAMTSISGSKRTLLDDSTRSRWDDGVDGEFERLKSCRSASGLGGSRLSAAYQVDVTPTIAALLQKPIPYSNFGRVIPEVLLLADEETNISNVERCNLRQLQRYFTESRMSIPRDRAYWLDGEEADTAQHPMRRTISEMSFFARRTRTDMHRGGMFAGCWLLLVVSLSILLIPEVKASFPPRGGLVQKWSAVVLVIRLCIVFGNSFTVNEDTTVAALWVIFLILLMIAQHRRPIGSTVWRGLLALVLFRLLYPLALRHRSHITHAVEGSSYLDDVAAALPGVIQRMPWGVWTGSVAWYFVAQCTPSARTPPLLILGSALAMTLSYQRAVFHHVVPIACGLLQWGRSKGRQGTSTSRYAYFLWVLWVSTLCNERLTASVVIAIYGAVLPTILQAASVSLPIVAQLAVVHLGAYVAFFMQGHQCVLSTIDWNASFVGLPEYSLYLGAILVLSRTFSAFLFGPVVLAILQREAASSVQQQQRMALLRHLVVHLAVALASISCFNGFIQKTHLMLYPVFCPKLLFDVITCGMTGFGYVLSLMV